LKAQISKSQGTSCYLAPKAAVEAAEREGLAAQQTAVQKQLEVLRALSEGAFLLEVHGPLIQELHAKLALSPGQGTQPAEDDGRSTASWLRVEAPEAPSQAQLRRHNGDVHA
jgi:hypothetical protein